MPTRTHTYRGIDIAPCESAYAPGEHAGHWAIRTSHSATGIPWADQQCPHAYTLAEARSRVDDLVRAAEMARAPYLGD